MNFHDDYGASAEEIRNWCLIFISVLLVIVVILKIRG